MPGLDKTRFIGVSENDLDDLSCGICLAVFDDPVLAHCCQQIYCKDCLHDWLDRHQTCPTDCQPKISHKDIVGAPKRLVQRRDSLKIRCDYHENGCDKVLSLPQLTDHIQSCHYKEDNKCQSCGQSSDGAGNQRHNCIDSLKRKLQCIEEENKLLMNKNRDISSELDLIKLIAHLNDDEGTKTHNYTGKYVLTRSLNHDQILRKVGASQAYIDQWNRQKHRVNIQKFGETYCMSTTSGTVDHRLTFKLGHICEEREVNGTVSRLLVIADGNKLIETKDNLNNQKKLKIIREFCGSQQKVRTFMDGLVSLRIYDKVSDN